jgi:predicted DNA binding CopG/RHH family protein
MKKVKKKIPASVVLDNEEKELLHSFEEEEWKTVSDITREKQDAQDTARRYLQKDARINIRLSNSDLNRIKQKAAYEGLPYQTLIASILHKYSAGHFDRT